MANSQGLSIFPLLSSSRDAAFSWTFGELFGQKRSSREPSHAPFLIISATNLKIGWSGGSEKRAIEFGMPTVMFSNLKHDRLLHSPLGRGTTTVLAKFACR